MRLVLKIDRVNLEIDEAFQPTFLCKSTGYSAKELTRIQRIVEEHKNEIKRSWKKHFKC